MQDGLMILLMHLSLDHIPRRMRELGYGLDYSTQIKHLVLQANEEREINAYNQLYILLDEPANLSISSDALGVFDMNLKNTNELQYEHFGKIKIKNNTEGIEHVRFIHVIPKLNTSSNE